MSDLVKHFCLDVSGDFSDSVLVWQRFLEHVNALPGVTVLGTLKHDFPGGGLTGLVLLGESHAAIHTWPELGRAWIELATCGDIEAIQRFREWKYLNDSTLGGSS